MNKEAPMPDNKALNRAVAEKIFKVASFDTTKYCPVCGWKYGKVPGYCRPGDCSMRPRPTVRIADLFPDYCGDANLTKQVVEEMRSTLCFQIDTVGSAPNIWRCMIGWGDDPVSEMAEAATFGRAVCLAALKAHGVSVDGL